MKLDLWTGVRIEGCGLVRGVGIRHLEEGVSLHPVVSLIKEAVCLSGKERETSFETVLIRRKEQYQNTFIIISKHTTLFFQFFQDNSF